MQLRIRWRPVLAVLALLSVAGSTAVAQESDLARVLRSGWSAHVGVVRYGTGAVNCATGHGVALGAEARTRGAWIGGLALDLFLAAPMTCTNVGKIAMYRGKQVEVRSGSLLHGVPRLRARFGRAVSIGSVRLEPSIGLGALYSGRLSPGGDRLWSGWAGGSVAVYIRNLPVGVEVEYGAHQIPVRYFRYANGREEMVHQFRRWRPLVRFSVVR